MEQALARVQGGGKRDSGAHAAEAVLASLAIRDAAAASARLAPASSVSIRYTARAMPKVCHVCGKGPAFGQSRSHSMVATKRRFDPNLQRVRIDVGGTPSACTSAPAA